VHGFLFTGGKKSMQNHQHCETLGIAQTRSLRCGGLEQTKERYHSQTQPARLVVGFNNPLTSNFKPNRENKTTDFPTSEKGRAKLVLFP
jgi:hypothetical protein